MTNVYNFGAGPSKVPEEVYGIILNELNNFNNTGISVLETSHRSTTYKDFNSEVKNVIKRLLDVPDDYKIIFLAGGGQGQFAAVPLNLISRTGVADYVVTGPWSAIAAHEAKKYGKINMSLPFVNQHTDIPMDIPDQSTWNLDPNASYVHICFNDTINGVQFDFIPDTEGVPLVADMSSNIMTKKLDISKFGVIYGCAQKNMGTAGVTLIIVREDLLNQALPICPSILNWTDNSQADSILNTPPMFAIYVMGRNLQWVERKCGLDVISVEITKKSSMIYEIIDSSNGFYSSIIARKVRSNTNIPFRIKNGDEKLETEFLDGAMELGLIQLKGHKLFGGIRVSTYNAITIKETETLADYMKKFLSKYNS